MTGCPHCGVEIARESGDKTKIRTSIVVLHKGGGIEINCPACKGGIIIPTTIATGPIRKSARYVISKS
ncbi:MAG: hypothetical protein M3Q55_13195 [Acidobacteriota bacterium]|nr:hypothetical protein [Acidobacteriota bacterium]